MLRADILRGGDDISTRFPGYIRLLADGWAMVTGTTLTEREADASIRSEVDFFRDLSREFEWKVYSWDRPSDLKDRLLRHGFTEGDEEAIMVFNLAQGLGKWSVDFPHTAIKVSTDAHLEDYRSVERQLEADHSYLDEVIDSLRRGSTDAMAYLVYVDGQPVSIARLHCHAGSPFGGCFGGSTLPEFRRMGCYRALLSVRAREAIRLGAEYLQVDSLPTSRPILERLGFEQIGSTWPFKLSRAALSR
jgi:GNAT superfamily N-acetyltransferase